MNDKKAFAEANMQMEVFELFRHIYGADYVMQTSKSVHLQIVHYGERVLRS